MPRLVHPLIYLNFQVPLQGVEVEFDLLRCPAILINVRDTFFKIHAGLDGAKDFVTRSKNSAEKLEFVTEELIDPLVGSVVFVQEIHHDHIVFLAVAVTATNALLNTLRIPRQIVIHHERAELQVDSFRSRFRGDHNDRLIAEIIYKRLSHVGTR